MPLIALQQLEGRAPDMLGIFPQMTPDWPELNTTLKQGLSTERPMLLIKPMPGVDALYDLASVGDGMSQVMGPIPAPTNSFEAPYTPDLRWLGIDWTGQVQAGGALEVTLYWRAVQPPATTWHSFLHVYDASGQKVAQAEDHRPGGDYLPSTLWQPGDVIRDTFHVPLPATLAPGEYTLMAGFYVPDSGQRIADPLPWQ